MENFSFYTPTRYIFGRGEEKNVGAYLKEYGAHKVLLLHYGSDMPHEVKLISPTVIAPIQTLKTDYMQSRNPRLHTDEMLVALAISAATDENAMRAMQKLDELSGCDLHSSVILGSVDDSVFKRLGINVTCEATYEDNNLYHK